MVATLGAGPGYWVVIQGTTTQAAGWVAAPYNVPPISIARRFNRVYGPESVALFQSGATEGGGGPATCNVNDLFSMRAYELRP